MPVLEDYDSPDIAVVHLCVNCGAHAYIRPTRGQCPTCRSFKLRTISYDPGCQGSLMQDLIDQNERCAYLRLMKAIGFA